MQAEQAGGNDNHQWRERAAGFPKGRDFSTQRRFERRLKRAEQDFAWCWSRKVASRTHSA